MTDRELFQQTLAALCQSSQPAAGYRRNELHLTPKPHVELYQEAIEALRARLAQPEPVLVTPYEFVKQVEGKEDFRGIPVMMSVWPTQEDK